MNYYSENLTKLLFNGLFCVKILGQKLTKYNTDIVIIGAGPVGLFAVFEAGMLKMQCHVVDALEFVGGQCNALYPEKPIYDIPAHPQISAAHLIENLEEQAKPFNPTYHLGQQVDKIEKHHDGIFTVTTSRGTIINAKAIVIAAGCGAFGPNRPPIDGIENYENKSVFYMVNKCENFRDKRVVIAGGGDSAVDWAIILADIAKSVAVVHRRDKFRCAPENSDKLHSLADLGKIELLIPYQLDSITGSNGQMTHLTLSSLDGDNKTIEADILLPFFGLAMELGPIAEWGLTLSKKHIEVNPVTFETSLPGVYAIGDIATYTGKLKLILNGFAEAAMAMHAIYPSVHPDQALHFEYSTTKGINK